MKFHWNNGDWYINDFLAMQLDTMLYNIKKDWDFIILITGDRMVRVGKSVLAQIISAYLAYRLAMIKEYTTDKSNGKILNKDAYTIHDIHFDNKEMMDAAFKKPKYSIDHYDEGREGLAANKAMGQMQKDLIDFFTECGQMNHIFVIVAPDFFDLKEDMAVARSEILINVYRKSENKMMDIYNEGEKIPVTVFSRGHFEFFSRKKKAMLYDSYRTSRRKWYGAVKCDFLGDFTNQYPIGEEEYRQKKRDSLARFQQKKEDEKKQKEGVRDQRMRMQRDKMVEMLHKDGVPIKEIAEILGITKQSLYQSAEQTGVMLVK